MRCARAGENRRRGDMARAVGIGLQSFEKIVERKCFYVDKTGFIREW